MADRMTLNQGEKLILKCAIDSNPFCHQIRWYHNGKELLTQSCSAINRTPMIAEYFIPNVYRIHSGKYTCEVKNWLNTGLDNRYEATAEASTEVRIQCKFVDYERKSSMDFRFRCAIYFKFNQKISGD